MAVSVRIEDEAFSDRRYDVLAQFLGLPDADCARGKMAAVWRQCTQQQTHVLIAEMVCAILGANGPDALVKSELGAPVAGGIRICGTRGRIEWLAKLRKNARKGGAAKSAKRHAFRQASGCVTGVPDACPPAPAPAPAPAKEEEEKSGSPAGLALLLESPAPARNASAAKRKPAASPDHQAAIDAFHQRFKARYGGEKPDWNGKSIGLLSALLKRHSLAVLIVRMDFMFAGKAKWPQGPYSPAVFVQHFDRWIDEAPVPQQPLRRIEEL